MSKELADRLEQWLKWTILNRQEKQLLNEAIAALRSEPVAEVKADERAVSGTLHWRPNVRLPVGTKLPAAPSRETDQRESSGIRIEGSQSPGSNPAPMHGQSKTGLTGSHPGAPTTTAEPALSAEDIANMRRQFPKQQYWTPEEKRKAVALCDAALSSLTARDEGIEAAALLNEADIYLSEDIDYLNSPFCKQVRSYLSRGQG